MAGNRARRGWMRGYRPRDLVMITVGFIVEAAGVALLFVDGWRTLGAVLIIAGTLLVVRVSGASKQRIAAAGRKAPNRVEELDYRDGP